MSPDDQDGLWLDIRSWYAAGDREAGARVVQLLHPHAHPSASFARVLGQSVVDELAQDVLVRVLDRERRLLEGARDPVALVRTVARNMALDAMRTRRRRAALVAVHGADLVEIERASDADDGDVDRALHAAEQLPLDSRVAVLLIHAPARLSPPDWGAIAERHPPPPPPKPQEPLDRDAASRLLWPPDLPEPAAERRKRQERIRKVLERAYARLAELLAGGEP